MPTYETSQDFSLKIIITFFLLTLGLFIVSLSQPGNTVRWDLIRCSYFLDNLHQSVLLILI